MLISCPTPPDRGAPAAALARPPRSGRLADQLAALVAEALLVEVRLTPKPGLVDLRNTGSHRDLTLSTFTASVAAIRPWLGAFFHIGFAGRDRAASAMHEALRPTGLACERAMFAATFGVNTHKGSIFAFGLLLGAAGRVMAETGGLEREAICEEVARIAQGVVERELMALREPATAGERLYRRHGLTGARGEAASGFATVRDHALPALEAARACGHSEDAALKAALLRLMAANEDTNLAARGGLEGLRWAQAQARAIEAAGGIELADFDARFAALDDAFIERNLSPGGSADLLAVAFVLDRLSRLPQRNSGGKNHVLPDRIS